MSTRIAISRSINGLFAISRPASSLSACSSVRQIASAPPSSLGESTTHPTRRGWSSSIGERHNSTTAATAKRPDKSYDVFIIGGGITGTALLYSLASFTDLKTIGLAERRNDLANVSSHGRNNSQTIHCGDIESNYSLTKAKLVKRQADMLRNFATKLRPELRSKCIFKFPKMLLGVGPREVDALEKRYEDIKELFPSMRLLNKKQVAEVEPWVAMRDTHTPRPEDVNALYSPDEHTAVDYYSLSHAFCEASQASSKKIDMHMECSVNKITQLGEELFEIDTNLGVFHSRFVVVSACGHSLVMAQSMGYGLEYSCLPMAGSFYFAPNVLNGKVYTVQNPLLPFAAVHGDPDVVASGKTRFGPTALPLPMLERYNYTSILDYFKVANLDTNTLAVFFNLFKVRDIRNYVLRNVLFEFPIINRRLFLKDAQKIVPSLKVQDISYAEGFGGVRPQLINRIQRKLILGEGKIRSGKGIVFNITPSPGGTTCLGNAEVDMREIANRLGLKIDEEKFKRELLEGDYAVSY